MNDPKVYASLIFCGSSFHSLGPAYLIELLVLLVVLQKKPVQVMVQMLCDLKYTYTACDFRGFRFPTSFCAVMNETTLGDHCKVCRIGMS